MKASPRQQLLLLGLQDLDNVAARLRRRREQLPERAQAGALEQEVTAAKQSFMSVQRELDTQLAEIERLDSDTELVRVRLQRDEQLLSASSSTREVQALQQEIEVLTRRKSELEDRELQMMESHETTQRQFEEATQKLESVQQRRRELGEALAQGEREIDAELKEISDERAGHAAELQRDLLDHYEALRARHGLAVARLRGNVSEASNMELAPAELASIRSIAADELAYCPQSGAILVRIEDEATSHLDRR
jgi:predicted  nucleic acid-binding Zn-ribbon protein